MAVRSNKRALIIPPPCRVAESVDVYGFMGGENGDSSDRWACSEVLLGVLV